MLSLCGKGADPTVGSGGSPNSVAARMSMRTVASRRTSNRSVLPPGGDTAVGAGHGNLYKPRNFLYPEVKPMGKGRPSKCPHCKKSARSISKGFKYRAHGKAKDRKCCNCGKRYLVEVKPGIHRVCPSHDCMSD